MNDDPLAYFITWTVYGSWLQGDERGWRRYRGGHEKPQPLWQTGGVRDCCIRLCYWMNNMVESSQKRLRLIAIFEAGNCGSPTRGPTMCTRLSLPGISTGRKCETNSRQTARECYVRLTLSFVSDQFGAEGVTGNASIRKMIWQRLYYTLAKCKMRNTPGIEHQPRCASLRSLHPEPMRETACWRIAAAIEPHASAWRLIGRKPLAHCGWFGLR